MTILSVYRPPFELTPQVAWLPEGLTLAELAARMPGLPSDFGARGVICVNGRAVERRAWAMIRPKARHNGVAVEVTFHAPPQGGEDTGKSVLALVASIALTAFTGGIAGGSMASLLGKSFAAKTFGAYALATGVQLIGSLALASLSAPPVAKPAARLRNEGAASAQGNTLEPNGPIPLVIGERKVFPPLACEPLTYFDGPDEVVEAVFCLAGPHRLTDIRVGAAAIADLGVEYETREGWPGDPRLTLARRQSRTVQVQAELRGHIVDDADGRALAQSTGNIADDLPQPYIAVTRAAPDRHWLHLTFPQGLHEKGSETVRLRVPIRLQMRAVGDVDWINLPELHFQAANIRQLRATIELLWTDRAATPSAARAEGWVEARRASPGQTATPVGADWAADAAFGSTGAEYMSSNNLGSAGVLGVECDRYTARILLDPADFPPATYELRITRGAAFAAADYDPAAYTVDGDVWDFWGYQGTPGQIVRSRDGVSDALYLLRSVSVWDDHPVQTDEVALIAIRARNRALENVSCVAGRWVRDWDGAGWNSWVVTSNPAPHLRDIYLGALNANPVPLGAIDDASLLAWRADGHQVNAIAEDLSVAELAGIVAGAGYARPYMSEVYGVARDYDRSAEAPVQIFTPRNSSAFSWSKGFAALPDGLRVSFRDAAQDYETRQITVARAGLIGPPRLLEQVSYDGLVTEAEVRARAEYDLETARLRSTFYSLEAPVQAVVARRGDLVAVQHDMISEWHGAGIVLDVTFDGSGDVTHITLDSEVQISAEPDLLDVPDLLAVADMLTLGLSSGAIVRGPSGPSAVLPLANTGGATNLLELVTPIPASSIYEGALVSVVLSAAEILRLIVFSVDPLDDYQARLTLVDEAPELLT